MRVYEENIVRKVRALRESGLSLKAIGKKLSINDTTLGIWCRDITPDQQSKLKVRNRNKIKFSDKSKVDHFSIDKDKAFIFASMLYWAEGTKYPHSSAVSFSNSDPIMVAFFVKLIRSAFTLDENKFKIHLQIHSTHNKKELFEYWSNLLNIPVKSFWNPTVTDPTNKMKRNNYKGTCTVRYHDYRILLRLIGVYELVANKYLNGGVAERSKAAHC